MKAYSYACVENTKNFAIASPVKMTYKKIVYACFVCQCQELMCSHEKVCHDWSILSINEKSDGQNYVFNLDPNSLSVWEFHISEHDKTQEQKTQSVDYIDEEKTQTTFKNQDKYILPHNR